MQQHKVLLKSIGSMALLLSCAWKCGFFRIKTVAAQSSAGSVIYLDQAWSQADREMYYQISQGAQIISYNIFLNLEVADSQELFRSDANSERYGLIPQAANPRTNPDGLPIGLTKTVVTEGRWKGEAIGANCALCHTAQLTYQGKRIRIDGGVANTLDFMSYTYALDDALQATLADAAKFDRLAARLGASSSEAKGELRKRFESDADRVHQYRTRLLVDTPTVGASPARCHRDDRQSPVGHDTQNSRELLDSPCTDQAPFCLEFPARDVDPMARRATGSNRTQPDRDYGRLHADGPDLQDPSGRPLRIER